VKRAVLAIVLGIACNETPIASGDEPTIPIGFDAIREWDRWPYLRIGTRTYMRSTFDRSGGNEGSDASHFIRLEPDRAIALDVRGPGVAYFERTNRWHGSPWHYRVDGVDHVLAETNTATPDAPAPISSFIPGDVLGPPLDLTWSTSQGSDLVATPIPFTSSLSIGYERTHYGTGYFIYSTFPEGAENLSSPLASWQPAATPEDVDDLLAHAGEDPTTSLANIDARAGTVAISASAPATIVDVQGPAMLRALSFSVPQADAQALGDATLRITWDGRAAPSIEAPVSLFFGAGTLFNRTNAEWLVKALPVSIHFVDGRVVFSVFFPMPFFQSAHVEIASAAPLSVDWTVRSEPYRNPQNWVGYLHATYVDHGTPPLGHDLVWLDTTATEGGGDWCGAIVGTSFVFSDAAVLSTLEGDPRFFFDDSMTPQVQGTGTEEWGGGGDYWSGQTTTLPFYGHPVGAPDPKSAQSPLDLVESAYRFLLSDEMTFGKNARVQFEHGGVDDSTEHYRSVVYWYGLPGACLLQTDALHVGDDADESAHAYASPNASSVDTVSSRWEWGVDQYQSIEIFPATTDTGRHTNGASELSLALSPDNRGVMLRRKLDLSFPDQTADVFVAPDDGTNGALEFVRAGTWYTAGSSSCVYSNPPGETDAFAPITETVDRRWREDEFLVARALTAGHTRIRVRIVPAAGATWSEFRYTAYSWTLPPLPP
jgi:hypothetical protein